MNPSLSFVKLLSSKQKLFWMNVCHFLDFNGASCESYCSCTLNCVIFLLPGNCICFSVRFEISLLRAPTHFLLNLVGRILPVSEFFPFEFCSRLPEIILQYTSFPHGLWQSLQPFLGWMGRSCDPVCPPGLAMQHLWRCVLLWQESLDVFSEVQHHYLFTFLKYELLGHGG